MKAPFRVPLYRGSLFAPTPPPLLWFLLPWIERERERVPTSLSLPLPLFLSFSRHLRNVVPLAFVYTHTIVHSPCRYVSASFHVCLPLYHCVPHVCVCVISPVAAIDASVIWRDYTWRASLLFCRILPLFSLLFSRFPRFLSFTSFTPFSRFFQPPHRRRRRSCCD